MHDPGANAASPKLPRQVGFKPRTSPVGAPCWWIQIRLAPARIRAGRRKSCTRVMSRDVSRLDEASAGSDEASEGWQGADETVRDLARAMIPGTNGQCTSHTVDDLRLQPQYQAAPDVGRASDLAQPGGFRRVHVLESGAGAGAAAEYARQPLVTTLLKQGRTGSFVTDLVQLLEDGSAVRFESRPYRRGRKPVPVRTQDGPPPPPRPPLQFCGFRPWSVPYWVGMSFLVGSALFTVGSVDWMLPYVGDTARGASEWADPNPNPNPNPYPNPNPNPNPNPSPNPNSRRVGVGGGLLDDLPVLCGRAVLHRGLLPVAGRGGQRQSRRGDPHLARAHRPLGQVSVRVRVRVRVT